MSILEDRVTALEGKLKVSFLTAGAALQYRLHALEQHLGLESHQEISEDGMTQRVAALEEFTTPKVVPSVTISAQTLPPVL